MFDKHWVLDHPEEAADRIRELQAKLDVAERFVTEYFRDYPDTDDIHSAALNLREALSGKLKPEQEK